MKKTLEIDMKYNLNLRLAPLSAYTKKREYTCETIFELNVKCEKFYSDLNFIACVSGAVKVARKYRVQKSDHCGKKEAPRWRGGY